MNKFEQAIALIKLFLHHDEYSIDGNPSWLTSDAKSFLDTVEFPTEDQAEAWQAKATQLDDVVAILDTEMGGENKDGEWERHDINNIDFEDIGIQIAQKLGY